MRPLMHLEEYYQNDQLTYSKIMTREEGFRALAAFVSSDARVYFHVLSEVALLFEGHLALVAAEWTVLGVGQQVVDERVPIREGLGALIGRAVQNSECSMNRWHAVLQDEEGRDEWNVLRQIEQLHIEMLSLLHEEQRLLSEPFLLFLNSCWVKSYIEHFEQLRLVKEHALLLERRQLDQLNDVGPGVRVQPLVKDGLEIRHFLQ